MAEDAPQDIARRQLRLWLGRADNLVAQPDKTVRVARDQQRLENGPLKEYPQYPNGEFGEAVPRAGNASGGGQPGWAVQTKGGGSAVGMERFTQELFEIGVAKEVAVQPKAAGSSLLAKLANAPFIKVEATKFTEVGYVGRDVEQIVRDLIEIAISMEKVKKRKEVFAKAQKAAEEKVLDALVGKKASLATRESFRKRLRNGDLDDNEIEIAVSDTGSNGASFEIPGMPGANVGMINIGEMIGKSMGNKEKKKKMTVKESHEILINDESDKLIEQDKIVKAAKLSTENNGIVFLDEIDKISARTDRVGGDVSREGVQRDLLPLIEGTTVNTKHGPIKTDHILFIASGAFQLAKPSDLLPELQGRLPIRVELEALTSDDFKRILKEPDYSLIKQYVALLKTENVELEFSEDGIDTIANIASEVNATVENIGARRLHTIIEKILDDISFTATDRAGEKIIINKDYINKNLDNLVKDTDLSKFIL